MVHGPVRCQFRSHMTPISASVIYPELPDPLTPAAEIPGIAIEHVARRMGIEFPPSQIFPERTRYRHCQAIFKRFGVASWRPDALALTKTVMRKTTHARTDPADIINSAIDALIRHGFVLPAVGTLRRLAGTAYSNSTSALACLGSPHRRMQPLLDHAANCCPRPRHSRCPTCRVATFAGHGSKDQVQPQRTLVCGLHWVRSVGQRRSSPCIPDTDQLLFVSHLNRD